MVYLVVEIALLLLAAFLIGLLIGWWFTRGGQNGRASDEAVTHARIAQLESDLGRCGAEKADLRRQILQLEADSNTHQSFVAADAGAPPRDDLKRISGIGPILEGKLNAIDVWRYEQIANWTRAEVEAFNQQLNFKGRIEREFWVDQAKMLAERKETDFSRRYDEKEIDEG